MDEYPIVRIPDAIRSFKHASSLKRSYRRKHCNKTKPIKNSQKNKTKLLCKLFSRRIAHILINPPDVSLCSRLEKLLNVVTEELKIINKKSLISTNINNKILTGASKKVTLWIDSILEESSLKLLEEDLRELEEQEGPVLDFIDILMENVLKACKPEQLDSDHSDLSFKTFETGSQDEDPSSQSFPLEIEQSASVMSNVVEELVDNSTDLQSLHLTEIVPNHNQDNEITILSHDDDIVNELSKEINNIIDSIALQIFQNGPLQNITDNKKMDINNVTNIHTVTTGNVGDDIDGVPEAVEINEHKQETLIIDNAVSDNENISVPDDKSDLEKSYRGQQNVQIVIESDEDENEIKYNVDDENKPNVPNYLFNERFSEERNKKVKFTRPNKVTKTIGLTQVVHSDTSLLGNIILNEEKLSLPASLNSFKLDLHFSAPNEHLLSDADEFWPADIVSPTLKPSASVCKSITSLGKIMEFEEQSLLTSDPSEENLEHKVTEGEQTFSISPKSELPTKTGHIFNVNTLSDSFPRLIRQFVNLEYGVNEQLDTETNHDNKMDKALDEKDNNVGIGSEFQKSLDPTSNVTATLEDIRDLKKTSEIENDINEVKKNIDNVPFVDLNIESKNITNVVNIAQNNVHYHHGERTNIKREFDIKTWCTELEQGYKNLELWNLWISNACEAVLQIKKIEDSIRLCPIRSQQYWRNLKANIDKDATMWLKFNKQIQNKAYLMSNNNKKRVLKTNCKCKNSKLKSYKYFI
nr:uncharacterized protein LOC105842209 isoform X4 [Bombyx mori]